MLQWYIRALADQSVIVKTYHTAFHGIVAMHRCYGPNSFIVIMLWNAHRDFWRRCWELTPPNSDVKKCQQAFLAPLPGMALGVKILLIHKYGNINKR